ncbi:unnamed protein product [Strongylus vulgaris]|uniref:Uncharacterized protein n=1 Tax=Strongylus vulgaris TaxID=40348 RepID=A0A3P7LZR2_STRVU|nr:unnamed protein product [Strongylus vulgaris]
MWYLPAALLGKRSRTAAPTPTLSPRTLDTVSDLPTQN